MTSLVINRPPRQFMCPRSEGTLLPKWWPWWHDIHRKSFIYLVNYHLWFGVTEKRSCLASGKWKKAYKIGGTIGSQDVQVVMLRLLAVIDTFIRYTICWMDKANEKGMWYVLMWTRLMRMRSRRGCSYLTPWIIRHIYSSQHIYAGACKF